jgi:hypothetical protein
MMVFFKFAKLLSCPAQLGPIFQFFIEKCLRTCQPLNILHVFRAPIGGLIRHVLDLTREQVARVHRVGLIADSRTGGENPGKVLRELKSSLAPGLSRFPMRRNANLRDLFALAHVMRRAALSDADVVHGHGAKGGVFSRIAFNTERAMRVYTPHGGSLRFSHNMLAGKIYLTAERLLMPRGDLYLFKNKFSAEGFNRKMAKVAP